MNEQEIRRLVRQEIQSSNTASRFQLTPTSNHQHNGTDSPPLYFKGLADTPVTYEGQAGKVATVKTDESGLEFDTAAASAAGGSDTSVQYNASGSIAGDDNLVWDYAGAMTGGLELDIRNGVNQQVAISFPNTTDSLIQGTIGSLFLQGAPAVLRDNGNISTVTSAATAATVASNGHSFSVLSGGNTQLFIGGLYKFGPSSSVNSSRFVNTVNTTDNAFHSMFSGIGMPTNSSGLVWARVVGHRTGGSAGTANDSFSAEVIVGLKCIAGIASLASAMTYVYLFRDQAAWDVQFLLSTNSVILQVRGATNNNVSWNSETWFLAV